MNVLAPLMLAGAGALAVPVILHLIARHRFPVQDFPTIRLLRFERRANVFAWKLVDAKQLLLRLLVLALLVAAMARLFAPWLSSEPAPRNLVVVVDASASMRMEVPDPRAGGGRATLLDLARRRAAELLGEVRPPSRCALIAAGETTRLVSPLAPDADAARAGLETVRAGDGTGPGLVRAVARACEMLRGRREVRSQIVVVTDLRGSAFEARDQWSLGAVAAARADLGERLEIVFLDISAGAAANVAIVDARVRGRQVRAGDDVHVIAHVANNGPTSQPVSLRLSLAGRSEPPARPVPLRAGGEAFVDLTSRVNRAQRMFGQVALQEGDALPIDDRFVVPVHVADVRRVLIVRPAAEGSGPKAGGIGRLGGDNAKPPPNAADRGGPRLAERIDGATILRYALNPGRELGANYSTGIDSILVTAETLATQPLSKYDIIILYDVSSLPDRALADLDTFVRQGKSVLMVCSAGISALRFNKTLAAGSKGREALSPAQIGNDRSLNPPVGIDPEATRHPVLSAFRDRLAGDLSVVRFATVRETRALQPGASVAVRATDGTPLIIERPVERGRVMLLTFGVELDRGNIARSRAFPAILWRLADYLTGLLRVRPSDVLPAGQMRVLDVSEAPFAFETALDLTRIEASEAPKPSANKAAPPRRVRVDRLAISPERQVVLPPLPAGQYQLHKSSGTGDAVAVLSYFRPIAVNGDARESRMARAAGGELQKLFGPGTRIVTPERLGELVPRGGEFWTILVVLLLAAYAVEAAAGWIACVRSERMRAAEAAR